MKFYLLLRSVIMAYTTIIIVAVDAFLSISSFHIYLIQTITKIPKKNKDTKGK